ncbi:MAG: hypothetical protein QM534_12915 [Sediminibacterium sp.]|nr:hypothetical protein [Sediminibacterium sp.]
MLYRCFAFLVAGLFMGMQLLCQEIKKDTIYLMNGNVINEMVLDTSLGAVTINHPSKINKKLHFENDQLYSVHYHTGIRQQYYVQDTVRGNWFTREEMWLFMKGERDAKKGFKARGALIGSGVAGLVGGLTGTFFAPIAPYGYMALSGITKVRIRHHTVSNPNYLESDAYILGYERVARQKRRTQSLLGGTAGLILGYVLYAALHQYYPETINVGFSK